MQKLIEGLQILQKYTNDVCAEHDLICVPYAKPNYTDILQLEKLGWHYDEDYDAWNKFV